MEFREADPDDAEGIRAVAAASLHAAYDDVLGDETVERAVEGWYDPEALAADLDDDELAFVVCEDDGDLLAFAQAHRREGRREGRIQWLHVRPDRRGEGIGGRLLGAIRERLRASGLERVSGEVLAANEDGNEFYREHGFALVDQHTVEVGGSFEPENVYAETPEEAADLRPVVTPEGEMYADLSDTTRGKLAPFYPVYRSEDATRRYGWLCGNCETTDNAMDAMGRIECNTCGNRHKADRWDASYL